MSARSTSSLITHDSSLTHPLALTRRLWVAAIVLALVVAVIPGLWSAAGLVALIVCATIVLWPETAVYLLALSVPLSTLPELGQTGSETSATASVSITPNEALVALLVVGWVARALARRRLTIPVTPLLVPLLLVVAAVVISAYQATELSLTLKESLKWGELLLVYLFVAAEMRTRRQILTLLAFLFAAAAIEALIGLAQFALGMGPEGFAIGQFMRAFGTFEQPNPFAGYLGMLTPMLVAFLLSRPSPRVRNAAIAIGVLVVAAVAASLSRGAWGGIGLALAAMALFWSRRSRVLLGAGAVASAPVGALAFLNVLPAEVVTRLATVLDYFRFIDVRTEAITPDNFAVLERVAHWQAALDMIAAHPVFGVGAGNYPAVYKYYMVEGWEEPLGHAHNYYLNMAAETGIPGLMLYVILLAAAFISLMVWLVRSQRTAIGHQSSVIGHQSPGERARRIRSGPWRPVGLGATLLATARSLAARQVQDAPADAAVHTSHFTLHTSFWRAILLGVLGALVATSIHNMFDNLFVHGMSIQFGMLLGMAQVAAMALAAPNSTQHSAPSTPKPRTWNLEPESS